MLKQKRFYGFILFFILGTLFFGCNASDASFQAITSSLPESLQSSSLKPLPLMPQPPFQINRDLPAEIAPHQFWLNNTKLDQERVRYPILQFNGMLYCPLTSDYVSWLGLALEISEAGLMVSIGETPSESTLAKQEFLTADERGNRGGDEVIVRIYPYALDIAGETLKNPEEEYPWLLFKDMPYMPLAEELVVEKLGLRYGTYMKMNPDRPVAYLTRALGEDEYGRKELIDLMERVQQKAREFPWVRVETISGEYYYLTYYQTQEEKEWRGYGQGITDVDELSWIFDA